MSLLFVELKLEKVQCAASRLTPGAGARTQDSIIEYFFVLQAQNNRTVDMVTASKGLRAIPQVSEVLTTSAVLTDPAHEIVFAKADQRNEKHQLNIYFTFLPALTMQQCNHPTLQPRPPPTPLQPHQKCAEE